MELYMMDVGTYPTSQQGLQALRTQPTDLADPTKWLGPYLQKDIPLDPWSNPYVYELINAKQFRIYSAGPDGASRYGGRHHQRVGLGVCAVAQNLTSVRDRQRRTKRRAMTLLELILVLALLVMISAMAMPAFTVPFAYHRLLARVENWCASNGTSAHQGHANRPDPDVPVRGPVEHVPGPAVLLATRLVGSRCGPFHQFGLVGGQCAARDAERAAELPAGVVFVQSEVESDTRSFAIEQQMQGGQFPAGWSRRRSCFTPTGPRRTRASS